MLCCVTEHRVTHPVISAYPVIGMFIDYQICLVFVIWIWYQAKYKVIVDLWRKNSGLKKIVILEVEIKWYLINLRFVATGSRSGHLQFQFINVFIHVMLMTRTKAGECWRAN